MQVAGRKERNKTQGAENMADAMPAMDRAGTQGWRRSRQVAMPASRGSDSKSITARHSDKALGQNLDLCRSKSLAFS